MKKHYLHTVFVFFFCCISFFASAQVYQQWVRRYNGPGSSADRASALALDVNQDVYVVGNGGFNMYERTGGGSWFYRPMYYQASKRIAIDREGNIYFTSENSLLKVDNIYYETLGDNGGDVLELDRQLNVYTGGQQQDNFVTARYNKNGQLAWARQYNGPGNGRDSLTALAIDTAGNVYACGISKHTGGTDAFTTIKYDSLGNEQWVRHYTAPGVAYDLALDPEGNPYITGGSGGDYLTLKYDPSGNLLWAKNYNGPGNGADCAYALKLDASGNCYVTGSSTGTGSGADYATLKYDASGNLLWANRYNGTGNGHDIASLMALDQLGNIIVTGGSKGSGTGEEYATIKYDPQGKLLWTRRYNGHVAVDGGAHDLQVDREGNVLVTGVATVKYDAAGKELWANRYHKDGHGWDVANDVTTDRQGFVYVTGSSEQEFGANPDYATIKYDSNGREYWVSRYNGPANGEDVAVTVVADGKGNTYVTGWSQDKTNGFDITTIKYDAAGQQLWLHRYDGPANGDDKASSMAIDARGNVYVTGSSQGNGTGLDYVTLKYDASGRLLWTSRYDGNGQDDHPAQIAVTAAGQVYVTGVGQVKGSTEPGGFLTLSYNSYGQQQWVRGYGTGGGASALATDGLGNIFITGELSDAGTDADYVTLKYDAAGNLQWMSRYNGSANGFDKGKDIVADREGNVYVTGVSSGVFDRAFLRYFTTLKYDHQGRQQWVANYSAPDSSVYDVNEANAIALDSSGNVVVTGVSEEEYATVAYNKTGSKLWEDRYGLGYSEGDYPNAITVDSKGNVLVTGRSDSGEDPSGDRDDYLTIRYARIPGGIIGSFNLINAKDDHLYRQLHDNDTLNLPDMWTDMFNIRANTEPGRVDSVQWVLSGREQRRHTERIAPYTLFGNKGNDYFGWQPAEGDYTLTAIPYLDGIRGKASTISFHVINQRVGAFVLMNADTDQDLDTLRYMDTLNLSALPTRRLNIRAVVLPQQVGSMVFELNETRTVENIGPYALAGNKGTNYLAWTPAPGQYRLRATPYAHKNGYGVAGTPRQVTFTVIDSLTLSGFTLVDAATDRPIGALENGAVIDLAKTSQVNILADTGIGNTRSVRFDLNGHSGYRLENIAPFALAANSGPNFSPWPVSPGIYTITATPFGNKNGKGKAGTPISVTITVIDTRTSIPTVRAGIHSGRMDATAKAFLHVLPNPVVGSGTIRFNVPHTTMVRIALIDLQGRELRTLFSGRVDGAIPQQRTFSLPGLKPGVYFCRLQTAEGLRLTEQVVVQ